MNLELHNRLGALLELKDGWDDTESKAPSATRIAALQKFLADSYPAAMPAPLVIATPEGDIYFEWREGVAYLSMEIKEDALELLAADLLSEESDDLTLGVSPADWVHAWEWLQGFLE